MLVPGGVLLFTVPYGTTQPGREHFPSLRDSAVVDLGGEWVLVNRARDGTVETFRDLVFHGGDGSTLEMRVYTEARLRGLLADAGFTDIRIAGEPYAPFGVEYRDAWSLPIAARKGQGPGRAACFDELALRYSETFAKLAASHAEFNLLRGEYSKHVGWAEAKVAELEAESRERLDHAARVEKEFEERTAWALSLQADLQAAESAEASARAESEAAKAESAAAREQLESARARLEQNDRQLFVRILKKLGLIRA